MMSPRYSVRATAWISIGLFFATVVSFQDARAGEGADASSLIQVGQKVRVAVVLEASGKLRLNAEGRGVEEVPLSITGRVEFLSQLVAREEGSESAARAIRRYQVASGKIHIRKWEIEASLSKSREVLGVAVERGKAPTYFSPLGPLTAQDLDIVSLQFDPLVVDELMPGRRVTVGDSWKVTPTLLASVFGLDAVLESEVTGTVRAIDAEAVRIELLGSLEGTIDGVTSRIEVRGKVRWDRAWRRVSWVAVQFVERRGISHAAPGFETKARLRMEIRPHRGENVADAGLRTTVAAGPNAPELLVALVSPSGFELLHSRRWRLVVDGPDVTVLRMIDGGELIAQANITRLDDGKPLTLAAFQQEVERALGDRFHQWVVAEEKQQGDTHRLHVVAAGEAEGLAIQWIYYHVRDGRNRRATVAFTVESKLVERFAGADEQIVATLKFTDRPPASLDRSAEPPKRAARRDQAPSGPVRRK